MLVMIVASCDRHTKEEFLSGNYHSYIVPSQFKDIMIKNLNRVAI